MKKHKLIYLGGLLLLFGISLQGCNCTPSESIQRYNIILTQPDGSIPKSGWAVIYEKHLDPNTSYATHRVPISDTITWDTANGSEISWTDLREIRNHSISIECFSPEDLTHDALRYAWHTLDSSSPDIEISFPQVRPLELVIRSIPPLPSTVQAWALYVSPFSIPPEYIEGTSSTTSQFNAWTFANNNPSKIESSIEFREHSTMYVHLFRLDSGIWHSNGSFTADLNVDIKEFSFFTNHTMSCCE
jgi:hypothetical protein